MALRIDHIGSTSVPGLAAKDVIDIQITVAAWMPACCLPCSPWGIHSLKWSGATTGLPAWKGRKVIGRSGILMHPQDSDEHIPMCACWGAQTSVIRSCSGITCGAHPATAESYAELKRRLAKGLADQLTYPEVKDPAVDLIYLAAEEWAAATGWQPPPSDV